MVRQLLNDQIENSRATMAKKMYDRQVSIITVAWKAQMIEEDGYVLKLARQVKLSDYFTITKFNQMPYWMMRASGCLYVGLLNLVGFLLSIHSFLLRSRDGNGDTCFVSPLIHLPFFYFYASLFWLSKWSYMGLFVGLIFNYVCHY
ncbi:uncharacterized protein LOC113300576 [Papaver somniferum]|uniref:uncharacterized protein LOC113300576 n=1 Tax=Papaver somniferum TaxID=3469 RepID=UPI000E704C56|nr:uncharacterized protein LOC113300576 [Papaver somniferum]XP_026405565.1 uncharacterized protein LOC113300576 [Papaver somniferum]